MPQKKAKGKAYLLRLFTKMRINNTAEKPIIKCPIAIKPTTRYKSKKYIKYLDICVETVCTQAIWTRRRERAKLMIQ
jgi:hypothetical protein